MDSKHLRKRFSVTSDLTEVAKAKAESDARRKSLEAQHQEEKEYGQRLSMIIQKRLGGRFPPVKKENILAQIEGHVKRSVTRVVADSKKNGQTSEEATDTAMTRGRFVAEQHGLNDLTDRMLEHIKKIE